MAPRAAVTIAAAGSAASAFTPLTDSLALARHATAPALLPRRSKYYQCHSAAAHHTPPLRQAMVVSPRVAVTIAAAGSAASAFTPLSLALTRHATAPALSPRRSKCHQCRSTAAHHTPPLQQVMAVSPPPALHRVAAACTGSGACHCCQHAPVTGRRRAAVPVGSALPHCR
jgi:hypothetical protein